jgi:hypothetical protein
MLKDAIVLHSRGERLSIQRGPGKEFSIITFCCLIVASCVAMTSTAAELQLNVSPTNLDSSVSPHLETGPTPKIWEGDVGDGFSITAQSLGISAGALIGYKAFGSEQAHHLAMVSFTYSHMISPVWGDDKWYRGNLEFRIELFTGSQFSPTADWFVGLTPHLRYNFATGTRWVPFLDAGAGVTATQIGPPDLSGTFEFNLQGGGGIQYFLKDNLALALDVRCNHWSCAGISEPNKGLNGVTVLLGVNWFF